MPVVPGALAAFTTYLQKNIKKLPRDRFIICLPAKDEPYESIWAKAIGKNFEPERYILQPKYGTNLLKEPYTQNTRSIKIKDSTYAIIGSKLARTLRIDNYGWVCDVHIIVPAQKLAVYDIENLETACRLLTDLGNETSLFSFHKKQDNLERLQLLVLAIGYYQQKAFRDSRINAYNHPNISLSRALAALLNLALVPFELLCALKTLNPLKLALATYTLYAFNCNEVFMEQLIIIPIPDIIDISAVVSPEQFQALFSVWRTLPPWIELQPDTSINGLINALRRYYNGVVGLISVDGDRALAPILASLLVDGSNPGFYHASQYSLICNIVFVSPNVESLWYMIVGTGGISQINQVLSSSLDTQGLDHEWTTIVYEASNAYLYSMKENIQQIDKALKEHAVSLQKIDL